MQRIIVGLMMAAFCLAEPMWAQEETITMSVSLEWDANTDVDLAGYKVYYKKCTAAPSGAPYDGTGAIEGGSPIDVGNVTEFTLTGLTYKTMYCFVVTAYDTDNLESDFSNEVDSDGKPSGVGLRIKKN